MYYPEEVVEEVRSRNNIVDVISTYVNLKRSGSNLFGLCPFHSEKSPSFSVSPSKQIFYCFGCGAGGNVISFVMQYENYSFQEAVKYLADRAGMTLPEPEEDPETRRMHDLKRSILDVNRMAAGFYYYQLRTRTGEDGMNYLRRRNLTDDTMKSFGLGYAGKYSNALYQYLKSKQVDDALLRESGLMVYDEKRGPSDKFWNRVMFPITDVNHRVIGFGGRVMGDGKPKYLNSPETAVFDKGRNLYGLNFARSSRRKELIVCEGYMDVISMHQAGFTNAVASLGTALTEQHASLLKRYTEEVVLSYDSDDAGVRAALRAIPLLRGAGIRAKVLSLAPYKDPDEFIGAMGTEAFEERVRNAQGSFFFELEAAQRSYNMADPESKTAFFREVAEKIASFETEIERENYIEAAAEKYHTSFEGLRRMVNLSLMKGIQKQPERVNFEPRKKAAPDEGILRSQRMLLTWLTEYPDFYRILKEYVPVEDYEEGFYRNTAAMLYEQAEQGNLQPARIISCYTDPEEQKMAAVMFQTSEPGLDEDARKKAMLETIRKVVDAAGRKAGSMNGDMASLQKIIETKRKLQKLTCQDL